MCAWTIQVADGASTESLRTVGRAVTTSIRKPDGSARLKSDVRFDAGGLLKGTAFDTKAKFKLELDVASLYEVDPSGNLKSFRINVKSTADPEDLVSLRDLLEAGKVTPVIDKRYSLTEAPEAIRYLEAGHARGKVVITV